MNLSIPDAAAELGVSETRLRKTLSEIVAPTHIELRQTRTGARKTTMLPPEAIALLRAHFAAPVACAAVAPTQVEEEEDRFASMDFEETEPTEPLEPSSPSCGAGAASTVPLAQFHALLYQHNVLREELTRVSEYLEGCDRLLGEMVRTIATLEERTRQLEPSRSAGANPLTGALRSVAAGVQNALFARSASAPPRLAPAEVYYANVLTGR